MIIFCQSRSEYASAFISHAEIAVFPSGKTESENWFVNLFFFGLRWPGYQVAFLERECSTYGHLTMSTEFRLDPAARIALRLIFQNNAAFFDIKADYCGLYEMASYQFQGKEWPRFVAVTAPAAPARVLMALT